MPNPKLRKIPPDSMPPDLAEAHEKSMALRGDATFFEVFANHPDLYRWYTQSFYGDVFRGGQVERRIKELVRLRLSTQHGCRFCNQGNRADALEAGLSQEDVDNVLDDAHFEPRERAALRLADRIAMTNRDGALDASLYAELADEFSDAEILELGFLAGILSGVAKFMFAFDLVEREPHCPFPSAAQSSVAASGSDENSSLR